MSAVSVQLASTDAPSNREGRHNRLLSPSLHRLYAIRSGLLRLIVRRLVLRLEGGEMYSLTIRRIFERYHGVKVGLYSWGAAFKPYAFPAGTTIGRYCSLMETTRAFNANHPMNLRSTHSLFYNAKLGLAKTDLIERPPLNVGNDVWIGHNAIILPSVRSIGDGAVIGAGCVVHRDVPPYAVVVGHPAVVVRRRFDEATIQELLASKWWDRTLDELKGRLEEFQTTLDGQPVR